jgi:hypothetical protein
MREMRLMVEKPFVLMSEVPEDSTVILLLPTGLRLTLMPVLLLDPKRAHARAGYGSSIETTGCIV